MKDEFFSDCIAQALDMGYRHFDLTPCTGDVFMDRGLFNKLAHMENASRSCELQLLHQFHHSESART